MMKMFIILMLMSLRFSSQCAIDHLEKANSLFRGNYKLIKDKILEKQGPILISIGDKLILRYKGQRKEVNYMPELYHRYKQIDHIPMILESMFSYLDYQKSIENLKSFRKSIYDVLENLAQYNFPADHLENQRTILNKSLEIIDLLCAGKKPKEDKLINFCNEVSSYLMKNVDWASEIQLMALHQQVETWKKNIPVDDWNQLSMVVIGPQTPRVGEVSLQYFTKVVGARFNREGQFKKEKNDNSEWSKDASNRRIIYAENLWKEEDALNLLTTHVLDEEIGKIFFSNSERMHIDVLAEGASKFIHEKCRSDWKCANK